jgi:transcriptional regulator with GAF, ATPase, and Fis domain
MTRMTSLAQPCESVEAAREDPSGGSAASPTGRPVPHRPGWSSIVGDSDALAEVLRRTDAVAATDSVVLILGETGTGKELLARHVHRVGRRSAGPFVATNVAAMPPTLLESELFGRERGAYTGAMGRQVGRFEAADGGTLFLDEVGEMPLETQVKLLRVLEGGEFERLGSSRTLRVDVRVIAATHRRLPELVRAGAFRPDLFYRLNVFPLALPPLRDRAEDIPALVWAFVREFSFKMGKPIDRIRAGDLEALGRHSWPGNVRELRNVVERSMILASDAELHIARPEPEADLAGECARGSRRLRDVEAAHVRRVLESTRGRIRGRGGAAEILDLKPTTLYSLMRRLGIERGA